MGRGRQKAKQTKVARQLKYYSPTTDLSALERELGKGSSSEDRWDAPPAEDDDDDWREASGR
mgnify:CR=1 FL=1